MRLRGIGTETQPPSGHASTRAGRPTRESRHLCFLSAPATSAWADCSTSLGYKRVRGPSRTSRRASDLRWSQGDSNP